MLISSINYQPNLQKNYNQGFKAKGNVSTSAERAVELAKGAVKGMYEGKTSKKYKAERKALLTILTNSLIIPTMIQLKYTPNLAEKSAEESAKVFEDFDTFTTGDKQKIKKRLHELGKEAPITKDNKYVMELIKEAFRNNEDPEAIKIIINTVGDDIVFARAADIGDPEESALEDNKNREVINKPLLVNAKTNLVKSIHMAKPTEEEMSPLEAAFAHSKSPEVIKMLIDKYGIQASIIRDKRSMLNAAEMAFIYNDSPEVIKVIIGKISEFCNKYDESKRFYCYDYSKLTRGTYSSSNFKTTCDCLAYNKNPEVFSTVIDALADESIKDNHGNVFGALSHTFGLGENSEVITTIIEKVKENYSQNVDKWLEHRIDIALKNNTNLDVLSAIVETVGADILGKGNINYIRTAIKYNKNPNIKAWVTDEFGVKSKILSDGFKAKLAGKNVKADTETQTDDFQIRELTDEEFEAIKNKLCDDIRYIVVNQCQYIIHREHLNKWNVQLIDYALEQLEKYNDYSLKELYKEFIRIETDKYDDIFHHHIKTECGAGVALRMLKNPWPFYNPDGFDDSLGCAMCINEIGSQITNNSVAIVKTNLLDKLETDYNKEVRYSSNEKYENIRDLLRKVTTGSAQSKAAKIIRHPELLGIENCSQMVSSEKGIENVFLLSQYDVPGIESFSQISSNNQQKIISKMLENPNLFKSKDLKKNLVRILAHYTDEKLKKQSAEVVNKVIEILDEIQKRPELFENPMFLRDLPNLIDITRHLKQSEWIQLGEQNLRAIKQGVYQLS